MWDDDYEYEPMTLLETAFVWSAIIGIFVLQALVFMWIGYQLAS